MRSSVVPIKKFYYLTKCLFFIFLLLFFLSYFNLIPISKFNVKTLNESAHNSRVLSLEQQVVWDEHHIVDGLGFNGQAVIYYGVEKALSDKSVKKYAMNVYLSEKIAYNRSIADIRHPMCRDVSYDAELPSASVIVIFHNEPYSVVIRTVVSVLNSALRSNKWFKKVNHVDRRTGQRMNLGYRNQEPDSKFIYLKEIILVDDNSTLPELKDKLEYYIETRLQSDMVKIIRLDERSGLIKARTMGARHARGDVLIFLDAHCECNEDWLRPLLQRIKLKSNAVLTPVIDTIDQDTFKLEGTDFYQIGGFNFDGFFTWIDIPEHEEKRRKSKIDPTWSPTMAGGLFAISRNYFWEIGGYDEQMNGWGGENLELSFRVWMCGGTLEVIPCSRVGHIFRGFHPYGLPAESDTHGINTARMAEVWMDDYKELFYLFRPDLRNNERKIGDITHRKVLREKLKCKSFQWYLDTVYKDKFIPVKNVIGFGQFKNADSGLCIDRLQNSQARSPVGLYSCYKKLTQMQMFSLTESGQLRNEEECIELKHFTKLKPYKKLELMIMPCMDHNPEQTFEYTALRQIRNGGRNICLDAGFLNVMDTLVARPCQDNKLSQKWSIQYSRLNNFGRKLNSKGEKLTSGIYNIIDGNTSRTVETEQHVIKSRSLLALNHDDSSTQHNSRHKRKRKLRFQTKDFTMEQLLSLITRNNTKKHYMHANMTSLTVNDSLVKDIIEALKDSGINIVNKKNPKEVTLTDVEVSTVGRRRMRRRRTNKPDTHTEKRKPYERDRLIVLNGIVYDNEIAFVEDLLETMRKIKTGDLDVRIESYTHPPESSAVAKLKEILELKATSGDGEMIQDLGKPWSEAHYMKPSKLLAGEHVNTIKADEVGTGDEEENATGNRNTIKMKHIKEQAEESDEVHTTVTNTPAALEDDSIDWSDDVNNGKKYWDEKGFDSSDSQH